MSPESVFTAEQWKELEVTRKVAIGRPADRLISRIQIRYGRVTITDGVGDASSADPGQVMAVANAALDANDGRRITREKIDELRIALRALEEQRGSSYAGSMRFLDALESILPPA